MSKIATSRALKFFSLLCFLVFISASYCKGQNKNFMVGISLGAGNSGFKIADEGTTDLQRIYYPMGGLYFQKRISKQWAIHVFPHVGMSGNNGILENPQNNITKVSSRSAFVNLAVHPKYFFSEKTYLSFGPELSYLLWNYGSTYNGDTRLTHLEETRFFNRLNFLASSAIGFSTKVEESRKNAPIQIDALWFIELRLKKGLTNILSKEYFGNDVHSAIFSIELATGISFASKN